MLSLCKTSMLNPLALYMLLTVLNYLTILSAFFGMQFSAVIKVVLNYFVWRKYIMFVLKNQYKVPCSCDAEIYLLSLETLVRSHLGFCGALCLLGEVVWIVHIFGWI